MKRIFIILAFLIPVIGFGQVIKLNNNAIAINSTDSTEITGDLIVSGSIRGAITSPKAYAYLDSNDVAITISDATWQKVGNFTLGGQNGTVTWTQDTMWVSLTGDYQALFDPAVKKAAGSSAQISIGYSINGNAPERRHRTTRQFTSADIGSITLGRTLSLTAGDYVLIKVRNVTNTDDVTFVFGEFELSKE